MPVLENPRHEAFAQGLATLKSAKDAYIDAGYDVEGNSAEVCASRLAAAVDVRARVRELQNLAVERTMVTIETITDELEAARLLAMADEKGASAAVAASMGKAKLHGLLVDRAETVSHNYTISDAPMPEAEWISRYVTEH